MYNYNFECDKVLSECINKTISYKDSEFIGNIIITENYLMIFRDIKINSVLRSKTLEIPEYDLIYKIKLEYVNYEIDDNNTIIKIDENEIILFDFDIHKVKLSIFCDKTVIN